MKILIIQQKQIGDVLTASVLLEALHDHFPQAELHYLVNSFTAPVVANNPFVHKQVFFTPEMDKSKWKLWQFIRKIRREQYDIVIDAYGKWSSVLISYFSKASKRISYHKYYTFFFFTDTIKRLKKPEHNKKLSIENRLRLLEPLSISFAEYHPKIYLTEREKKKGKNLLTNAGIALNRPLIMLSVLGSNENKSYPKDYMIELINHISSTLPNAQLLFNYSPQQRTEALSIFNSCKPGTKINIFFDVYAKNLREYMMLLSHCTACIGNEGGGANMAKALHIPTFVIFSPFINKADWYNDSEKPTHYAVHNSDFTDFSLADSKQAKKTPSPFYLQLKPELIYPELAAFLSANV